MKLLPKLAALLLGSTFLLIPWPGCARNEHDLIYGWGDGLNLIWNMTDEMRWEAPHPIQWLFRDTSGFWLTGEFTTDN